MGDRKPKSADSEEIATGPSNDCSATRSSDGQTDSSSQTECESSNFPHNTQSDAEMQGRFAIKARLNLFPVAAQKIKYGKGGNDV